MKCLSGIIVVIVVSVQLAQGYTLVEKVNASPRVVGGDLATNGEFPGAVFIERTFDTTNCVGTLVNAQHVVTSAQCLIQKRNELHYVVNPHWIRVIAGDLDYFIPTNNGVVRHGMHIMIHEDFNPFTNENDIAIIRLDEAIPQPHISIQPAIRRERIVRQGLACEFAGWGTNMVGQSNTKLTKVVLPIADRLVCNSIFVHHNQIIETMLCAGHHTTLQSVCDGNLGGGLYCNGELTGILSFGIGCGAQNYPSVYTQVQFYNEWINEQLVRTTNFTSGSLEITN